MQAYSDPKRASDPHALPDVEVFEVKASASASCPLCADDEQSSYTGSENTVAEHKANHVGFYWWACFPGCLPDGDPMGPFATQAEALADAQQNAGDYEGEE
jgi:hypothetical protein